MTMIKFEHILINLIANSLKIIDNISMENYDNIDTFMAEILGIENEYDVLNK